MTEARLYRYRIPLQPPVALPQGPMNLRQGLILQLRDSQGHHHYGEAAPLPGFSRESLSQVSDELQAACRRLNTGLALRPLLWPASRFAWDMAHATRGASPTAGPQPYPLLSGTPDTILTRWRHWPGQRPQVIKLKLGRLPVTEEVALLRGLLDIARVTLRIDTNRLWHLDQASTFASRCGADLIAQIDYVEEPTADPADFEGLYQQFGLAYAHDETTRRPGYHYQRQTGLRALILKPTLLGDRQRLASLAGPARSDGCQVVISSSFETSLGIDYLRQLAASLTPDTAPGLDTLTPFTADVLRPAPNSPRPLWGLDQLEPL